MAIQTILGDLKKDVAAIYVAVFGRAPEKAGLEFWLEQQSKYNLDLSQLADAMIQAAKDFPGYENIDDPQVLVTNLYENVLGKTYQDDPDGINYWVNILKSKKYDPGYVVEQILETAVEKYPDHPATKTFLNRVDVALETAENIETPDLNGDGKVEAEELKVFQKIIKLVTDDPNTVKQAEQLIQQIKEGNIPGENFELTTKADEIKGTMFNDIIQGVVSSLNSESTLNPNDKIDGGEGTDTINLDVKGSFNGFSNNGYMKNVEIINLTSDSPIDRTFSAKGIEGAKKFVIDASKSAINLSDMQLGAEVDLKNQKSGEFKIQYASKVTSGTNDEQVIDVENVGTPDNPATSTDETQAVTITANGIENLKINSVSGDNVIALKDDSAKTVTVAGKGNLTITGVPQGVTTFDASSAEGKVNVDLTNASQVKTIKGGKGDDSITVDISKILANASIEGGDGQDTLVINGKGTVQFNQSGVETVKFDKTDNNITYSALNATGIQNFVFTKNVNKDITLAKLGNGDYTVELDGKNDNNATITLDNTGAVNVKVAQPDANATASSPTVNKLNVSAQKAAAVNLTVEPKMAYEGILKASSARQLDVKADGNITLGDNSNLSNVQQVTIEANGQVDLSKASLNKAAEINLSGNGSVKLGSIGNKDLDYDINISAKDLPKGVTLGSIDTKTNVNINVANVTGKVSIGGIGQNQAPVNVNIDASNTAGKITLNNITAKNITIDAENALNGIVFAAANNKISLQEGGSLDFVGSQLKANSVNVELNGSKDVSVKFVGGIQDDTITIDTTNFDKAKAEINIKGDIGSDTVEFKKGIDVTKGLTLNDVDTLKIDNGTLIANAKDVSGDSFTLNGQLDLKGTDSDDTIDLSKISGKNGTITVEPGKGADTIKLGGATETIDLTAPFEQADKINDFDAGGKGGDKAVDKLKIDLDKADGNSFGATNQLPADVLNDKKTKAKIAIINDKSSVALAQVTILTEKGKDPKATALASGALFKGKDIVSYLTHADNNVDAGAKGAKAIVFFYDTDDHKLEVAKVTLATNGGNLHITKNDIKTVKTIATLTVKDGTTLDGSDILIY